MPKEAISLKCPQCGGAVKIQGPSFPFCSKRCRMLDLGKWFNEEYAVPGREIDGAEMAEEERETPDGTE